jgi:5-methylcytosine-specific restriction protein A
MKRPRIQTLKPRIAQATLRRVGVAEPPQVDRIRGRALQVRNARILRRDPLCKHCLPTKVAASTQIDHIVALHLGGSEDDSNLQGLCDPCHEAKSAKEQRDRLSGAAIIVSTSSRSDPVMA